MTATLPPAPLAHLAPALGTANGRAHPAAALRVGLVGPVTPDLGGATPGGVATHQVHLARALAEAGAEVALLATNTSAPRPDAWLAERDGMALYRAYRPGGPAGWLDPGYLAAVGAGPLARYALGLLRPPPEPLGSRQVALANLLWYRRFLEAASPAVVHVQHPLERHLYARLVARFEGRRPPLVVTLHSFFQEHPEPLIYGLMRPNLPCADRLIAVSRSTAEQAVALGADPARLRVIRSGVDAERFAPRDRSAARRRLGVAEHARLVLFVGNLEPRKRVDVLLQAFARLVPEVEGARLAIIGTGESAGTDDQGPRLRALVGDLGLADRVDFLGRVGGDDLLDWYAAADVFVLPSESEAQGIVALEAMACGLPVVVSAVGGLLDTVEDGRAGFLVPPGDVDALAARLRPVLDDGALRARVGAAARQAVVSAFSWERTASATLEVYREAIAEAGPAPRSWPVAAPAAAEATDVVTALALGDTRPDAERIAAERFPGARVRWLERGDLRRRPWAFLAGAVGAAAGDALLVAPDLDAPRLRLTGLLAALPRARRRWLADTRGRFRPWSAAEHLRVHAWVVVRHATAIALARGLARPTFRLLLAVLHLEARRGWRRARPVRARRILYLRSQFWFGLRGGGSVAHTAGVIGGLRAAGVDVRVVASDVLPGVQAPTTLVRPECWLDGPAREAEEAAYNVPFLLAAWRVARAWRPDALYQRYTALNVGGAVLSRLLGVPLVLEFNSSDVWKARHWGEFHTLDLVQIGEQVSLRAADRVVVVSRVLREELVAAGVPAERIVVNPNAVDPDVFTPDADGASVRASFGLGAAPVVGFSGTFGVWHGIPTLSAALPLIARQRPGARFLLVGDGPLRSLLDETVAREGLEERVVRPGLVPHGAMPAHLAACDVLLSPHGRQADGREFFGSPTKLFEYMAAGRAIVASAVGQIGDVLRDDETALLVPPEDPRALADAVARLLDDAELRERLGRAARAEALRSHTWRGNAERVLEALAE